MGKTFYDSITRDYAVAGQGFTFVVGISFVFVNLITDLLYTLSDPRVLISQAVTAFPGHAGHHCVPRPRRLRGVAPRLAPRRSHPRCWRSVARNCEMLHEADLDVVAGTAELAAPAPGAILRTCRCRRRAVGDVFAQILLSWSGRIGLAFAMLIVGLAVFAPLIAPYDPNEVLTDPAANEHTLETRASTCSATPTRTCST